MVGFILISSSASHSGSFFFLDILSESHHGMDELWELGRPGLSVGMKVLGTKDFSKHASSGLSQGHSTFLALSYWLLICFPSIGHLGGFSWCWGLSLKSIP